MTLVGICGSFFKEKFNALSTFTTFKNEMEKKNEKISQGSWIKQQWKVHYSRLHKVL